MAASKSTSKNKKTKKNEIVTQENDQSSEETPETLQRDFFDEFLFHAANYIYVRRKFFISLSVIILVVIVSGYSTIKYLEYADNLRNEKLFEIEQIIYDASLSNEEQSKMAMPLIEQFLSENPDTPQYELASFYRAGLAFKDGELEMAEEELKSLSASMEPGTDLSFLANLYLVNVLRDQNKTDEAVEILELIKSEAKSDALIDIVLMEQAELYMEKNQSDKAKESLEILLKDYPQSVYVNKARQMLELL